jgi:hypothetical protein
VGKLNIMQALGKGGSIKYLVTSDLKKAKRVILWFFI